MTGVKDKVWFRRGGLFAKYVAALVGLVVFVLAVNGAVETWISYRATKSTLIDAMTEKAEATARRLDQSISELERQISWVTRASVVTVDQRRADYTQLLNQVSAITQLSQLNGQGRETLRLTRRVGEPRVATNSGMDFSHDPRFTETVARGVSFSPIYFEGTQPFMAIAVAHSGFNAGVTVAEIDLRFLSDFFGDAQVGKATFAYVVDSRGQVIASSWTGGIERSRQAAAGRCANGAGQPGLGAGHRRRRQFGAVGIQHRPEARLDRVFRAADRAGAGADPRSAVPRRAADRRRPPGRDPRRHDPGAADADPDHGALDRRATARRRRLRPPHRCPHP